MKSTTVLGKINFKTLDEPLFKINREKSHKNDPKHKDLGGVLTSKGERPHKMMTF